MNSVMIWTVEQFRHDPLAKVDWRFRAIEALSADDRHHYADVGIDADITQLANDRRRTGEFSCDQNRIAEAIHREDGLLRAELEGRVVCDQPVDAIAEACGVHHLVVRSYELLFFDVREHLDAAKWLMSRVCGSRHISGFSKHELRQFFCHSALSGGLVVLEHLLAVYRECKPKLERDGLHHFLLERSPADLCVQTFVADAVIPNTPAGAMWFAPFGSRMDLITAGGANPRSHIEYQAIIREVIECGRYCLQHGELPSLPTGFKSNNPDRGSLVWQRDDLAQDFAAKLKSSLGRKTRSSKPAQPDLGNAEVRSAKDSGTET